MLNHETIFYLKNIITNTIMELTAKDETEALQYITKLFKIEKLERFSQEVNTEDTEQFKRLKEIVYDFGFVDWRLIKKIVYENKEGVEN